MFIFIGLETHINYESTFIMKLRCQGICRNAICTMSGTSLVSIISDFIDTLEMIVTNPMILQQFYDYIKMKFNIPCETGMLLIEKMTMNSLFRQFQLRSDDTNILANEKMMLYHWISPRHLEIKSLEISLIVCTLRNIAETEVPSVKIFHLMSGIKRLYEKVGKTMGFDDFFPYLVYCFIKANVRDIYAHLHYTRLFRRKYDIPCSSSCRHGFQVPVCCSCLMSEEWDSEAEYYLTTSLAVIDYIAKLEFYNLKVDRKEFDRRMSSKIRAPGK